MSCVCVLRIMIYVSYASLYLDNIPFFLILGLVLLEYHHIYAVITTVQLIHRSSCYLHLKPRKRIVYTGRIVLVVTTCPFVENLKKDMTDIFS